MKRTELIRILRPLALILAVGCLSPLRAEDPDPREAGILKTAEAFVEAFHKGDAKAVAAFWTTDGDYVDETGRVYQGRDAIEKAFAGLFAARKGLKVRIDVASLRFPSDEVALEDGTSTVLSPDGSAPSRCRYSNVLIKTDGKWLLSSVREAPDAGPSKYEYLSDLEWTIGEWRDVLAEGGTAREVGRVRFEWAPGRNFIVSTRTAEFREGRSLQLTQWIGWDAATRTIRSWSFQADGGHGESVWTREGGKWIVRTESVLADGTKVTSSNLITPGDADTVTWQTRDQKVNGQALPDTKEQTMKRVR